MSLGVYEISAKKSRVPAKRRTRANTSFHALSLSVRPTACDSNPATARFNHNSSFTFTRTSSSALRVFVIVMLIDDSERPAFAPCPYALVLHARRETDNCASALWLLSFARASSLFSWRWPCFLHRAKSILLDSCRKFRRNRSIRQRSGRIRKSSILRSIRLQERRLKLYRNLVSQRTTWPDIST